MGKGTAKETRPQFGRAAALLGAAMILQGCQPAEEEGANADNSSNQPAVNLPSVPTPEPPMDRSALLSAVAQAASAKASGGDDSEAQRLLDGRRFEFRIRFGCRGPAPDLKEAMFGWSRDEGTGTLRLRATPTIGSDNDLVQAIADEATEDVEGFWIPRPWLLSSACPAAAAAQPAPPDPPAQADGPQASKPTPQGNEPRKLTPTDTPRSTAQRQPPRAEQQRPMARSENAPARDVQETAPAPPAYPKVGIAQFFTETDSRTKRRSNRPYEAVKTLPPEQLIGAQGFNLVLSGRLRAIPGKGVIHCVARGSDAPPDCLVSANIDKVWIERPGARTRLAEWGGG